jgi:alkylation response protein AidB-like acyl-CoA dehydrogenase
MSIHLNDEQQRIVKIADDFAEEFLEPIAADLDRNGKYPKAVIDELAKHELLGLIVSTAPGAEFTAYVETLQRLSQSCPAIGSIVNNHASVTYAIGKWGSAAQKSAHLSTLVKGEALAAMCIYETGPALGLGPNSSPPRLARRSN